MKDVVDAADWTLHKVEALLNQYTGVYLFDDDGVLEIHLVDPVVLNRIPPHLRSPLCHVHDQYLAWFSSEADLLSVLEQRFTGKVLTSQVFDDLHALLLEQLRAFEQCTGMTCAQWMLTKLLPHAVHPTPQ